MKPEFFRHELLQELELLHPKHYIMLVFAGLWTQADSRGRFRDRPRLLKLDILPFLDYDISATLEILSQHGFIIRYEVNGEQYGEITAFETHQRITGKEATDGEKYPGNNGETLEKQQGSNQLPRKRKGKERKGYTPEFEKFWNSYPRKTAKGKAAESWNRDDLDSKLNDILRVLESYKLNPQWTKDGGQYIPYPATWLNGKCYDDEPTVKIKSASSQYKEFQS